MNCLTLPQDMGFPLDNHLGGAYTIVNFYRIKRYTIFAKGSRMPADSSRGPGAAGSNISKRKGKQLK